jgi:transmembrane sensor
MSERPHTRAAATGLPDAQDIDMNDELNAEGGASAIEIAAARWVAKLSAGDMTVTQREDLELWLDADPEHRRHFRAMQAVWQHAPARVAAASVIQAKRRVAAIPFAAAAAVVLAITGILYFMQRPQYELYTTKVGEQMTLNARDGSVINLNTGSQFALKLSASARSAQLRGGEAYFSVRPDPQRPFDIDLDGASIRVVGTHFNVRRESDYFSVAVVDGVVRVQLADAQSTTLTAGQRLTYRYGGGTPLIESSTAQRTPQWVSGRLTFDNVVLPLALGEAERYLTQSIVIADDRLQTLRVSGVFRVDHLDELVKILEEEGLVRVERAGDGRSLRLYAP